jgi:hypothetical protein
VPENSAANTPIATIRAFDRDVGKNSEVEYILEDSQMGKFSIGRIDGVLRCVASLDREQVPVFKPFLSSSLTEEPKAFYLRLAF